MSHTVKRSRSVLTPERWEAVAPLAESGVAFVGHHPTQHWLVNAFSAPPALKENLCVIYVMTRTNVGWQCDDHGPGVPKGSARPQGLP